MPSWSAPLVGPGLVVDLSRPIDLSMRITFAPHGTPPSVSALAATSHEDTSLDDAVADAFDSAFEGVTLPEPLPQEPVRARRHGDDSPPREGRAFGLPGATTRPVSVGSFVGDVRRGGSCNCETHVITPHGDGTHTEGVGHILHDRVCVLELVEPGLVPALVVTVVPARLDSVDDDVVGNHAPDDRVIDELSLIEAVERSMRDAPPHVKPRALIVRTAPGEQHRATLSFSGTRAPFFTVDAAAWVCGHAFAHLLVDLPSLDREDDGGLLGAHRAFFDVPARAVHIHGPPPKRTITEMIAVDSRVADGMYALTLQLAPIEADAVPSRPMLFPLVASAPSWLRQGVAR